MKRFITSVLTLFLLSVAITSCGDRSPQVDSESSDDTTAEITDAPINEYLFVSDDKRVCINHHYGNRSDYKLVKTPALWDGDTADLEENVRIWSELSGNHIILLIYERTPENADISERRAMVYTTKDMGESWSTSELPINNAPQGENPITISAMEIRMVDNNTPDSVGSIVLTTNYHKIFFYVTGDGGETWHQTSEFIHPSDMFTGGLLYEDIGIISFVSKAGEDLEVFITYDGGRTWSLVSIDTPSKYENVTGYVQSAYKYNGAIIIEAVFDEEVHRYVSFDRGQTWEWK